MSYHEWDKLLFFVYSSYSWFCKEDISSCDESLSYSWFSKFEFGVNLDYSIPNLLKNCKRNHIPVNFRIKIIPNLWKIILKEFTNFRQSRQLSTRNTAAIWRWFVRFAYSDSVFVSRCIWTECDRIYNFSIKLGPQTAHGLVENQLANCIFRFILTRNISQR